MERNTKRLKDKKQKEYLDREKELSEHFFPNKGILNPEQAKEFLRILTEEDPILIEPGITLIEDQKN